MNAPMTKFAIMRANREKQRQVEAYGRLMQTIDLQAMGKMPIQVLSKEDYHWRRCSGPERFFTSEDEK